MLIKNSTNGKTLTTNGIEAITWKQQAFGLLLHKNPTTMIFQTRFGIHTFGMKYPIDVVVLDKKNKVVVIKKNLVPNRIFVWNPTYARVIELPEGTIEKTQTIKNNTLTLTLRR